MELKEWIQKFNKIKEEIRFLISDYPYFELLEYRNEILSIIVLTKSKKKDFELNILKLDWLRLCEKHHKKTSNGLNQYLLNFKL